MSVEKRIAEMERLADAATPGPWVPVLGSGTHVCTAISSETVAAMVCDCQPDYFFDEHLESRKDHRPDMEYIAANDPDTVKALLRIVRAAEAYVDMPNDANQFRLVAELEAFATEADDE